MQPESLHNQLRFNLSVPYSINKLSARHKNPQPIVIEKADQSRSKTENICNDDKLPNYTVLDMEKLREAQFLVQRQLKKSKDSKLKMMEISVAEEKLNIATNSKEKMNFINKKPLKVVPPKSLSEFPVSGHSPPVRDKSTKKLVTKGSNHSPKETTKKQTNSLSAIPASAINQSAAKTVITKEKFCGDGAAFSTPDLHKMAVDQLINIKFGDMTNSIQRKPRPEKSTSKAAKKKKQKKSAEERAREIRERIYRQQLYHPLPTPHIIIDKDESKKASVPDLKPNGYHQRTNSSFLTSRSTQADELPDAEEFLKRVTAARREREEASRPIDPNKLLDHIEEETRRRLEPLLERVEKLSRTMQNAIRVERPAIAVLNPQSEELTSSMSADNISLKSAEDSFHTNGSAIMSKGDREFSVTDSSQMNSEDMGKLKDMLKRLDEMEREHVEIRQRWMTAAAKYDDNLLLTTDDKMKDPHHNKTAEKNSDEPKPMLLVKSKSQGLKTRSGNEPAKRSIKSCSAGDNQFKAVSLMLPEKVISSIEDGKKRYQKHLDLICHTPSAGFDPWKFTEKAANEILDYCITNVAKEITDAEDYIITKIYKDEFVAATNTHNPTALPT